MIKEQILQTETIDQDGNISQKTVTTTTKYHRNTEPDYIKIYTDMWCIFNQIPRKYHDLFFQLAVRMTYCNSQKLQNSQIVMTGEPVASSIRDALGWTSRDALAKGLRTLCDCGAIRRISRGAYQINPQYAGKGEWKYNPSKKQGGIEDLVATFKFKDHDVSVKHIWGDDPDDNSELQKTLRKDLGPGFSIKETKEQWHKEEDQNPSDDTLNSDKNWDTEDIPELKDVM